MQIDENGFVAGTNADSSRTDEIISVSQHSSNEMLAAALSSKTVLQELIEYFEQQLRLQRESNIKYTGEEAFFDALDICRNACNTKEKQQIKDAFNQGYREGFSDGHSWSENEKDVSEYEDAENYYSRTFTKAVSER